MSTDQQFAATFFPDRPVFAGARLRPLTFGHALLLTRLGSPLMPGGEPELSIADLALALEILRRPWPRCVDMVQQGRRARFWVAWRTYQLRRLTTEETVEQTRQMLTWLRAQWTPPATLSRAADGESIGCDAPLLLQLMFACIRELNLTESGVMALPMLRAQHLLAMAEVARGASTYLGDEIAAELAQAKAYGEQVAAERAAVAAASSPDAKSKNPDPIPA